MLDLKLNSIHDLDVSTGDLVLIDGAESVRQQLLFKLKLWRGEWFLDTDFGTPYLQEILGKGLTLSGALAALRKSILEVLDVSKINSLTYKFNSTNRTLNVDFSCSTTFGLIEVSL